MLPHFILWKMSQLAICAVHGACAGVESVLKCEGLASLLRGKQITAYEEEISSFAFLLFRANRSQRD
jgi:hypothetical protein